MKHEKVLGTLCSVIILCLSLVISANAYNILEEIKEVGSLVNDVPTIFKAFLSGTYCPKEAGSVKKIGSSRDVLCDETLGCFPNDGAFAERFFNMKPNERKIVNTHFVLHTRHNGNRDQILRADDPETIMRSSFDGLKETKLVVHGFIDSTHAKWFKDMNTELLKSGDYNVINVDWGSLGASKTLYAQATANTRVVAAEIVHLLNVLQKYNLKLERVHLIGHSLGAHIAGYVGANLTGIGRITGLDPADPYFQGCSAALRLDPSDADFVDIIHSDADAILNAIKAQGGFGTHDVSGHIDFFPNGGKSQPGCEGLSDGVDRETVLQSVQYFFAVLQGDFVEALQGIVKSLYSEGRKLVSCDHSKAVEYFIQSINKCSFPAVKCNNYNEYKNGSCSIKCDKGEHCNEMGFPARKPTLSGAHKYYLQTTAEGDLCTTDYHVKIATDDKLEESTGALELTFHGANNYKHSITVTEESRFVPSSTYLYRVNLPASIKPVIRLGVTYTESSRLPTLARQICNLITSFCSTQLKIVEIQLEDGRENSLYFCGSGNEFTSGTTGYLQYNGENRCL